MKRARRANTRGAFPTGPRTVAAALFLFSLGLYVNTLGHGFVFDDGSLILQNLQVTQFRWTEMFGAGGYRPVRTLTYAFNYAVGGESPFGYHLFNVLLHAANVLLLFQLLLRWSSSLAAAAIGSALFAAHPVQTAAVAYISGRKDLLATFFVLAGMSLYGRSRSGAGSSRLVGGLALFALAVFSKESAVVFPALVLLTEALVPGDPGSPFKRAWAALRRFPLAFLGACGVAAVGVFYVLYVSKATRMIGFWGGEPSANYGTSLKLFAHYARLVVWPHPLIADYKGDVLALSPGFLDARTLLSGACLTAFLVTALWMARKFPLLSLGMLWFFTCLSPVLQWVPFHELAADHFLYLPMVGVALITAEATRSMAALPPSRWVPAVTAVLLVCSVRTVVRNNDWKDARTLWEATYAAAPGSYRANANLGQLYYRDPALRDLAVRLTRRAVELAPDDAVAWSNLGAMEYLAAQQATLRQDLTAGEELVLGAIKNLEEGLVRNRHLGSIYSNLGNSYRLLGTIAESRGHSGVARENQERAIRYFETALRVDPKDEVKAVWYNLGLLYLDRRDWSHAAECFQEFLKVRPLHPSANQELGRCRLLLGDASGSLPFLKTAVELRPTLDAYDLLAQAYQVAGQPMEAFTLYEGALRRLPAERAQLHYRLGLLHWDAGSLARAAEHLREAASGGDPEVAARARSQLEKLP